MFAKDACAEELKADKIQRLIPSTNGNAWTNNITLLSEIVKKQPGPTGALSSISNNNNVKKNRGIALKSDL